jgi:hypothetical protein
VDWAGRSARSSHLVLSDPPLAHGGGGLAERGGSRRRRTIVGALRLDHPLHRRRLIVDYQDANVLLLSRTLRGAGFTALASTTNSREVCELHRKNRYDLILLDLHLPGGGRSALALRGAGERPASY